MRIFKYFIFALFLLPSLVFARGDYYKGVVAVEATPTITYDASSTGDTTWATTLSWTHTLGDNPNSVVIVAITTIDGDMNITGCNWDQDGTPVAMTALTSYDAFTSKKLRMFYILDPDATGAKTIQATTSSATAITGVAISIYNATETGSSTTNHDGSALDWANSATSISDTLTIGTNGSWVVSAGVVFNVQEDLSTTQGETERIEIQDPSGSDLTIAIATEEISTAGENTFGWSSASDKERAICIAEFEPL